MTKSDNRTTPAALTLFACPPSRSAWAALALMAASCEESEAQCAAACLSTATIQLHKADWSEGTYELVLRYPRYDGTHAVRCTFDLPIFDREIDCIGDGVRNIDPKWVWVSVDSAVDVRIEQLEPGDIELEIVPPEGESTTKRVQPTYARHEVCGQTCGTASERVDLDE